MPDVEIEAPSGREGDRRTEPTERARTDGQAETDCGKEADLMARGLHSAFRGSGMSINKADVGKVSVNTSAIKQSLRSSGIKSELKEVKNMLNNFSIKSILSDASANLSDIRSIRLGDLKAEIKKELSGIDANKEIRDVVDFREVEKQMSEASSDINIGDVMDTFSGIDIDVSIDDVKSMVVSGLTSGNFFTPILSKISSIAVKPLIKEALSKIVSGGIDNAKIQEIFSGIDPDGKFAEMIKGLDANGLINGVSDKLPNLDFGAEIGKFDLNKVAGDIDVSKAVDIVNNIDIGKIADGLDL